MKNIFVRLYDDDLEREEGDISNVARVWINQREGVQDGAQVDYQLDRVQIVSNRDYDGAPFLDIDYTVN